jgi:hypothetical protein
MFHSTSACSEHIKSLILVYSVKIYLYARAYCRFLYRDIKRNKIHSRSKFIRSLSD